MAKTVTTIDSLCLIVFIFLLPACTHLTGGSSNDLVLIEDFESASYGKWTGEGDAFGENPIEEDMVGILGSRVAASTSGSGVGTLTSPVFTIKRNSIYLLVGAVEIYGVKQTPDGGYIVAGSTGDEYEYSESGHHKGCSDLWLAYTVKTDAKGNLLWQGLYGNLEGNNAGEYINLTSDGGYVIFTDSDTAGTMGQNNFGLMKIMPDHVYD